MKKHCYVHTLIWFLYADSQSALFFTISLLEKVFPKNSHAVVLTDRVSYRLDSSCLHQEDFGFRMCQVIEKNSKWEDNIGGRYANICSIRQAGTL